jgi:hypothetical protein
MKTLLTLLFTFCLYAVHSQDLPNSRVNMGLGIGMNYGGIGTKTVLGFRNSGLLIGLGTMGNGILGYEVGAQVAIKSFYFNVGYGISGTYQVNLEPVESVKAGNIMVGYMISLGKAKTAFIDLAIGHTLGAPTVQLGPFEEDQGGVTFGVGIGYRLAKK